MTRGNLLQRKRVLYTAACAALSAAAWGRAANAAVTTFSYTGAAQTWTVPATGTYELTALGAQGGYAGDGIAGAGATPGGNGAKVDGFFSLAAGDQIQIDVGGMGGQGSTGFGGYGGAGGGGSWIYDNTTSKLLLVAGGGGGGYQGPHPGGAGQITLGSNPGQPGASDFHDGGGGGGYKGGATGQYSGGGFPTLAGGTTVWAGGANGGFGGGGASGGYAAGGGGGYSGGGYGVPAGGGYSFNAGTTPTGTAGFQTGNGEVDVNPAAVPEPTSAALLGAGGFAAFASRHRKRS